MFKPFRNLCRHKSLLLWYEPYGGTAVSQIDWNLLNEWFRGCHDPKEKNQLWTSKRVQEVEMKSTLLWLPSTNHFWRRHRRHRLNVRTGVLWDTCILPYGSYVRCFNFPPLYCGVKGFKPMTFTSRLLITSCHFFNTFGNEALCG